MKILPLIPAVLLILFCAPGCGGHDKPAAERSDTAVSLKGLWVNKAYVDTLLLTHSPQAAQNVGYPTCLYFFDTVEPSVFVELGFHEGTWWSVVRSHDTVMLCDSGAKRNLGKIETISPEELRFGQQRFIKLKHPNRDSYDDAIVEELLFAGSYTTKEGATIRFSPDGRIEGWEDTIRYFVPFADYEGPGLNVDQVELGANKDKLKQYAFKFDKDTLLIYTLKCLEGYDSTDNSCGVVDFGDLKWKLLKRH